MTLLNSQATIKNLPKTSIPTELLCLPPNQNLFKKHLRRRFIYQNNFCNYLTNPCISRQCLILIQILPTFLLWLKILKPFFENFALVNMSKLVISKPNISKTDISYLLKRTLMCTFQEVTNFIFKVDWFTFIKTNSLELFENFEPS